MRNAMTIIIFNFCLNNYVIMNAPFKDVYHKFKSWVVKLRVIKVHFVGGKIENLLVLQCIVFDGNS